MNIYDLLSKDTINKMRNRAVSLGEHGAAELIRGIAATYARSRPVLSKDLFAMSDRLFDARKKEQG